MLYWTLPSPLQLEKKKGRDLYSNYGSYFQASFFLCFWALLLTLPDAAEIFCFGYTQHFHHYHTQ